MVKLKILSGSSRPGRFNPQVVEYIKKTAETVPEVAVEVLDLATIDLPFLDEPAPPLQQKYTQPHTMAWSATIAEADAFIMVTPEYNHSFSPVLKNAIDYLYQEWNFKPVAFASYGSLAGGSRAVEHLRGVAAELKMYDLREQMMLPNYWEHLDAAGQYQFTDRHHETVVGMVKQLAFWGEQMKMARVAVASS